MLVETVNSIAKSAKCHPDEACATVLTAFFDLYQDSFLSVAVDKGISNGMHPKVMDEVSVEAMLSEAGVNWTNAHIIFQHLKQFFGKSLAVFKKKRRAYFGGNDFPNSVDRILLEDKTIVSYWWKCPEGYFSIRLIMHLSRKIYKDLQVWI
jgi:hypothetical protein